VLLREAIETRLAEVRRQKDEAEAEATQHAEELARLASGLTPLVEVDPERVQAAADGFAAAARRLKMLDEFARQLRGLLI